MGYSETLHQQSLYFNKSYDSVKGEVLYNIIIVIKVLTELGRMIK
jgi:hypothetical protein